MSVEILKKDFDLDARFVPQIIRSLGKAKAGPPAGSSRREPWLVFHRCNKGVFAVLLTISLILALAFASPTNAAPAFSEGVFYIDGTPYFLWSADYPYYRDNRADWSGQLDRIKAMNVKIVTFYIPWRHHVVGDPVYGTGFYDFTGQTQDNRDVKYFIDLIRQKGLYAIVKPGPFVHAELDYGGLPQYVSDAIKSGKIEAEKDSSDLATTWLQPLGIKLPAALDPYYLTYVQDWLIHVNDFIVANNYQYPNGPIVAIQLLNEGIYSNARERITGFRSYDWSLSSRDEFRNFIQNRYGTLDNYNAFHGTSYTSWNQIEPVRTWANPTSKQQALAYLDWAEYSADFYRRVFLKYKSYMPGITVPYVINPNAVYGYYDYLSDLSGVEHWLSRINPELMGGAGAVHGYTNWVGTPAYENTPYARYVFTATRYRGPNLEDNWAYSKNDPLNNNERYKFTTPSYFASMLFTAFGATGINVYTAVSTDNWTSELDSANTPPHPPDAPIAPDGTYRNKYWTAQQLGLFFADEGKYLVRAEFRQSKIAWGIYPPYAWADAWNTDPAKWRNAGFYDVPRSGYYGVDGFQYMLKKKDTEFTQVNIKDTPLSELQKYKIIFLAAYDWMDRSTQDKLVNYVYNGGVLVLTDLVPYLDENMQPYTKLKDTIFYCPDVTKDLSATFTSEVRYNNGEFIGAALWRTRSITLTGNAILLATLNDWGWIHNVAYRVPYGTGQGIFLGFHPWVNPYNNDGNMLTKNTGLVEYLAGKYAGAKRLAWDDLESPEVDVQEFINTENNIIYVFVLTKETAAKTYKIWYTDLTGTAQSFDLTITARSAAVVGIENGAIRSTMIRAINDVDSLYTTPKLVSGSSLVEALTPSDIMLSRRSANKYIMSVTNVMSADKSTVVHLPLPTATGVVRVNSDGSSVSVPFTVVGSNIEFTAYDTQSGVAHYEINL